MTHYARFALLCLFVVLLAVGCGRKSKDESEISPRDFEGWYYGTITGFDGATTYMDFRVGASGSVTSIYAGPNGGGRMEGFVDEHGFVTITAGIPGVRGTGMIRISGAAATASGTLTLSGSGKTVEWNVTLGTEPSAALLGTWYGAVAGEDTGVIGMDITGGNNTSGSIAATTFGRLVGGRVTPDGKVLMVGVDADSGDITMSIVCDLTSPTHLSGSWYDFEHDKTGSMTLDKIPGTLDITKETVWVGQTQDAKDMCVHLLTPADGTVLSLFVDPEGGLGGTGKMTADKRFLALGTEQENAMWGSITNNVATGVWYNFRRGTSGTFTATLYEGEDNVWSGEWKGSSKTPEQEAGTTTGTSGSITALVNPAGFIQGQFNLTGVDTYFITGKLDQDDSFVMTDETGKATMPGQFLGRRAKGTYDIPDQTLNGFFTLDPD